MSVRMRILVFLLLCLPASSLAEGLTCKRIYSIKEKFLNSHILYSKLSPKLKERTLTKFLEYLDPNKHFFLASDVKNIQRKNKKLFKDLKKENCQGLHFIYDIYAKRVTKRIDYALKYLSNNFKQDKKTKILLDDDLNTYVNTTAEANKKMETRVQHHVAEISFEEDMQKIIKQVTLTLKNQKKQTLSWKPVLNRKEVRSCQIRSKNSFQACKPEKWYSNYLRAYSQSLDSHSGYLDKEDIASFQIDINLELEGIGASLSTKLGYTVIQRIIPGGAAHRSKKLKVKDKILAVGQKKDQLIDIYAESINDVVSIIRGKKGTPVWLKILREGKAKKDAKTFVVKIIRDSVKLVEDVAASIYYKDVKIKGQKKKIGILRIPSFYGSSDFGKSVSRDARKLLLEAKEKNIDALVLDLSYNRGGVLDESVKLSGLFFASGNVTRQSEKGRSPRRPLRDRDKEVVYSGPLVVMVSRISASASEIVSGALQDYGRAVIVGGDHTFGKGSVQSIEHLRGFITGAVKTTVGLYFIPSGRSTQKTGVNSDIVFPSVLSSEKIGEKTLDFALDEQKMPNFKSPFHEIFSQRGENWEPVTSDLIETLRKNSSKRIAKSKEFKKIKKRIKKIKEREKKKYITVAEILEGKDDDDDEEDEEDEDYLSPEKKKERYFKRADVVEAINIAGEMDILMEKMAKADSKKTSKTL